MKEFDFDRWFGVVDDDNRADDYYEAGEEYVYCDACSNLMVPIEGGYKCPVCGCTEED